MTTVLLVDDEHVVRLLVGHQLEAKGLDVVAVASLDDVDDELLGSVGLVCCDLDLGAQSGLDLWERMSTVAPDVPFLLLTGTDHQEDLADERAAHVDAFLTKPTSTAELHATVDRLLAAPVGAAASGAITEVTSS